ncbi:MAG: hypothetical protein DRI36_03780, partial [Caldiserica bacterium]
MHSGASVEISSSAVNFNGVGVYVESAGEGDVEISWNKVESNNGYGIVFDWLGVAKVADNRIACNGSDGLLIKNRCQNIEILDNLISDNLGAGVHLTGEVYSDDLLSILGNTIMNNQNSGIVSEVTGIQERGQLKCAYNNIVGNTPYAVFWLSSVPLIEAENNWWGTVDSQEIEDAIYDKKDNPEYGTVKYKPYLTSFCEEIPSDALVLAPVTKVSGSISVDTVWEYPGVYVLMSDVTIENGVTLTIEPGVVVRSRGGKLTVNGTLIASGTEERNIVFTTQRLDLNPGSWMGIVFNDSSDDSQCIIKHATIEYAETGITLNNASPRIEDCLITRNFYGIKRSYDSNLTIPTNPLSKGCVISSNTECGIQAYHSIISVEDSIISYNGQYGIFFSSGGKISILRSTITYNDETGISINISSDAGDVEISSSVISHSYYGVVVAMNNDGCVNVNNSKISFNENGLYVKGREDAVSNVEIIGNKVRDNDRYGLYLKWITTAKVSNNLISQNGSNGLQVIEGWKTVEVVNNLISDNTGSGFYLNWPVHSYYDGIRIAGNTITGNCGSGMVGMVNVETKFQLICEYNNIFGNTPYELNWQSSIPLEAKNNWWGTTDNVQIEERIYHYVDNSSLGQVNYTPYLSSFCKEMPADALVLAPVTEVSGVLEADRVWKYPGVYVIKEDVTVNSGVTLTIEPGVEIWSAYRKLIVNGTLAATGESDRKITFTSLKIDPSPGEWLGIVFNDSSDDNASVIRYATVEYAEGGITLNNASPRIENCLISQNNWGVRVFGGSELEPFQNPISKGCVITNNTNGGILVRHSIISIEDSVITDNDNYGIYFSSGGKMEVSRSTISYNNGVGIYARTTCYSGRIEISSSVIKHNGRGVHIHMGETLDNRISIVNNQIVQNNSEGVKIEGKWYSAEVLNNLIMDNQGTGICVDWDVNRWDKTVIAGNTIMNNQNSGIIAAVSAYVKFQFKCAYNNIVGNSPYAFVWNFSIPIEADNNWWGTTDENEIEDVIYHYVDNTALGRVEYRPYLISFCEEIPQDAIIFVPVTEVSGVIDTDTVWKSPGIYVVKDEIVVNSGVTLTIEPRVKVWILGKGLKIKGSLFANGKEDQKILFTPVTLNPSPGKWEGITFEGSDNVNIMRHTIIEYAKTGIRCYYKNSLHLEDCLLNKNFYYGIEKAGSSELVVNRCTIRENSFGGIYVLSSDASIENSVILNNGGFGIYFSSGCALSVVKSTVSHNQGYGVYGYAYKPNKEVDISSSVISFNSLNGVQVCLFDSDIRIANSKIISNSENGIYLEQRGRRRSKFSILNNEVVDNGGNGIEVKKELGEGEILGNFIASNKKAGIYYYHNDSYFVSNIKFNTITNNQNSGIVLEIPKKEEGSLFNFSYNNIFNNMPYEFYYTAQPDHEASYNWWGADEENLVAQKIYDFYDNPDVGRIIYQPYLMSPWPNTIPPAGITDLVAYSGPGSGEITLNWTATGNDGYQWKIVDGKYRITYDDNYPVASTVVEWSTNTSPGARESKTITGLTVGVTYWFYIQLADEAGNWSQRSNVSYAVPYYFAVSTDNLVQIQYEEAIIDGQQVEVYVEIESTTTTRATVAISSAVESGLGIFSQFYDIEPDGVEFLTPAILTFYYNEPPEYVNEEELRVYRWDEETGWSALPTFEQNFDENWIKVKLYSTSIYAILASVPDVIPPVTELRILGDYFVSVDTENYVSVRSSFCLTAYDPVVKGISSGIGYTEFRMDDEVIWHIYEGTFTLSQYISTDALEGEHRINYRSVDLEGNVEEEKIFVFFVDGKTPISVFKVESERLKEFNGVFYVPGDARFYLEARDREEGDIFTIASGVKRIEYWVDEEGYWRVVKDTSQPLNLAKISEPPSEYFSEGPHRIGYRAIDNVNNVEPTTVQEIFCDKSPPQINIASPVAGEVYIAKKDKIVIDFIVSDNSDPEPEVIAYLFNVEKSSKIMVSNGQEIEPLEIESGFWTLTVEAIDWLDHSTSTTTGPFEVIHDILPPRTTVQITNPKFQITNKTFITSKTSFTLTAVDDLVEVGDGIGLGVEFSKWRIANSEWYIYEGPFTISNLPFALEDGRYFID